MAQGWVGDFEIRTPQALQKGGWLGGGPDNKDNKAFLDLPLPYAKHLEGAEALLGDRHIYVWVDGSRKNYLTLHKAIEKSEAGNRMKRRNKNATSEDNSNDALKQAFVDRENARFNRQ